MHTRQSIQDLLTQSRQHRCRALRTTETQLTQPKSVQITGGALPTSLLRGATIVENAIKSSSDQVQEARRRAPSELTLLLIGAITAQNGPAVAFAQHRFLKCCVVTVPRYPPTQAELQLCKDTRAREAPSTRSCLEAFMLKVSEVPSEILALVLLGILLNTITKVAVPGQAAAAPRAGTAVYSSNNWYRSNHCSNFVIQLAERS